MINNLPAFPEVHLRRWPKTLSPLQLEISALESVSVSPFAKCSLPMLRHFSHGLWSAGFKLKCSRKFTLILYLPLSTLVQLHVTSLLPQRSQAWIFRLRQWKMNWIQTFVISDRWSILTPFQLIRNGNSDLGDCLLTSSNCLCHGLYGWVKADVLDQGWVVEPVFCDCARACFDPFSSAAPRLGQNWLSRTLT